MQSLPTETDIVIIGGGIIGCSVAYHLALLGRTDVVLLERKSLTCGTTWHSGAVIGQLRPTYNMTRLAQYTGELLTTLEEETGQATGYKQNGALVVTAHEQRFHELKRSASMGRCFGLNVETLSPADAGEIWPLLNTEDLVGAVFLPDEGQTNPTDTTLALAKGARQRGVQIFENTPVTDIESSKGRVTGVRTSDTLIRAKTVVNCTGLWARELGLGAGVDIPLQAVEHMYVVTEPMPALTPELPSLRDHNQCIYYRVDAQQMLVGICEPKAKVWGLNGIPSDFAFEELPPDWDHIEPYLQNAMQRVPEFAKAGIKLLLSGPESITPDTRYLLGETPNLKSHFVAAGFSGVGVGSSGGAGKMLAEWIVDGRPSLDMWAVDVRRMMPFQTNRHYLAERVRESNGLLYAMHWPFRQHESARNIRRSPIHDRLMKSGACCGEVAGWERPNWYAPQGMESRYHYSFNRQNWFDVSAGEHKSVRTGVGFLDSSSDTKLRITGPDSTAFMNRVCANDIATDGKVVATPWLNQRGGTEALVSVTRLGLQDFLVLGNAASATRDKAWLARHICNDEQVVINDVTSNFALFTLAGPVATALIGDLAGPQTGRLRVGESRVFDIGYAEVRISRTLRVGEPCYHVMTATEMANGVYESVIDTGRQHGLVHVGQHAWHSLCMEKSVRAWGEVIGGDESPMDADLEGLVSTTRANFVGAEAALKTRGVSRERQLVSLLLEESEPQLYMNEPILSEQRIVGYVRTAMYGHTVGGAIGMGYIERNGASGAEIESARYEIEIAGERHPARATLRCFYDPENLRERDS